MKIINLDLNLDFIIYILFQLFWRLYFWNFDISFHKYFLLFIYHKILLHRFIDKFHKKRYYRVFFLNKIHITYLISYFIIEMKGTIFQRYKIVKENKWNLFLTVFQCGKWNSKGTFSTYTPLNYGILHSPRKMQLIFSRWNGRMNCIPFVNDLLSIYRLLPF